MFKNLIIKKATLVDILLTDTTAYNFCDYFKSIDTYTVDAFTISDFQNSLGNTIPNLQISSLISSALRTKALKGFLIKAQVTVTIRDLSDDSDYILFKGQVSSVTIQDEWIDLDCEGFMSLCNQNLNVINSKKCLNDLGINEEHVLKSNCSVNLTTFTVTGAVTSVTSRSKFIDTSRTESSNYFRYGILTFTSGSNNGISREVMIHDSSDDSFTFFIPFPYDIAVSDTYSVYRGCDKTSDICKSVFNNYPQFRGYAEYTPDQDALVYNPDDDDDQEIDDESDEVDDAT